jgi:hypothetical protein
MKIMKMSDLFRGFFIGKMTQKLELLIFSKKHRKKLKILLTDFINSDILLVP